MEEEALKIGSYEGGMLNGDLTNLPVERHFDRLVSEDRSNIEVIGADHRPNHRHPGSTGGRR